MTPPSEAALDISRPDVSDLVIEDDTPVDSILSEKQQRLLTEPLYTSWAGPPPDEDGKPRPFAALANVGLFWSANEPPVVPDVMLSVDVAVNPDLQQKKNRSYFVWEFGKVPEVVIEIVSNREGGELKDKLRLYRRLHISYYAVYDPLRRLGGPSLRVYELRGDLLVPAERIWLATVGLGLVEWQGTFECTEGTWLRWCTRDGQVIPTGAERAKLAEEQAKFAEEHAKLAEGQAKLAEEQAKLAEQQAKLAEEQAKLAEDRAKRLEARLRAMGVDPENV